MKRRPPAAAPAPRPAGPSAAGEVRIISGLWKRSRLRVLPLPGLRPTPDRVRETVFNWLGSDLSGWRVLDAFAGSGALGFEAASRGAEEVVLLDSETDAVRELAAAHQRLHAPPNVRILRTNALDWMARSPAQAFELIFIDPPFGAQLAAPAAAAAARLLVPGGWLVIESPEPITGTALDLITHRQLRAGAVCVELRQAPQVDVGIPLA